MKIAISSQNPTKLTAVETAARAMFDQPVMLAGYKVATGVSAANQ